MFNSVPIDVLAAPRPVKLESPFTLAADRLSSSHNNNNNSNNAKNGGSSSNNGTCHDIQVMAPVDATAI
jgi:hypothetical protein